MGGNRNFRREQNECRDRRRRPLWISLSAHLQALGVDHQIFGQPMQFWSWIAQGARNRFLKSFGLGTNIYVPEPGYSFVEYCRKRGLESFEPCPIADFAEYGLWVQRKIVPSVKPADVVEVSSAGGTYNLALSTGEHVSADNVVIATGLASFARLPEVFTGLPRGLVGHTSEI